MNAWFYVMCVLFVLRFLVGIFNIGKGDVESGINSSCISVGQRLVFRTIFDSIIFFGSMGFFASTGV